MNLIHRWLCRSDSWRNAVKTHIVPWVLEGVDLGCEDATAMSLADAAFDSAVSLTMLHHVPSAGLQGTFAERLRVAGLRDVRVDVNPYAFRFFARR